MHAIRGRHVRATLLGGAVLLSGCGGIGVPPTRPPEPVAIRLYTRGAPAPATFSYVVTSDHADVRIGDITVDPGAGCFYAGGAWTLEVHDSSPPDMAEEPIVTIEGDDPPTTPVDLAISVEPGGRVEMTEGVPAWWTDDLQRCVGE